MEKEKNSCFAPILIVGMIVVIFLAIVLYLFFQPNYSVWAEGKKGEAELARAESNRKIKTLEAVAAEDSAKHLAKAEVERARGVAQANKIIGQSLQENEAYLRYLWISGLQHTEGQVIYVPTEANLPILESRRLEKAGK